MSRVSLYDVLGVAPDATSEEIKAAWREATDAYEPGQGSAQFRLFNEAADVLLDPDRRAAYDAELAEGAAAQKTPAQKAPAQKAPAKKTPAKKTPAKKAPAKKAPAKKVAGETVAAETAAVTGAAAVGTSPAEARPRRAQDAEPATGVAAVPAWVVAVLAVLTTFSVIAAAVLTFIIRSNSSQADAGDEASAAAERALPVALSYDYRHLTADRDQAVRFQTPRYRKEYTATFDKLVGTADAPGPAVQVKAVVKATVKNVGVVSATENRARIIVFLNQAATKNGGKPTQSLNRLVVTMVKSGNQWLLDNIDSY